MNSENNSKNNSKSKKRRWRPFYNFCYDFVKITGVIPALIWLRPKIYRPYGRKLPKGAVPISSNHITMIDPIFVLLAFPTRRLNSLATKDLYSSPLKRFFFNQMHCIEVDKNNFTVSAFHEVVSRLKDGRAVVIFPEGEVNKTGDDTMLAFKSGAVLMAHRAAAPILPMYIVKRDKWYRRQRIVIGEPFSVNAEVGLMPSMDQLSAASDTLREKEIALREYFDSLPIGKKLAQVAKSNKSNEKGEKKDEQKV